MGKTSACATSTTTANLISSSSHCRHTILDTDHDDDQTSSPRAWANVVWSRDMSATITQTIDSCRRRRRSLVGVRLQLEGRQRCRGFFDQQNLEWSKVSNRISAQPAGAERPLRAQG